MKSRDRFWGGVNTSSALQLNVIFENEVDFDSCWNFFLCLWTAHLFFAVKVDSCAAAQLLMIHMAQRSKGLRTDNDDASNYRWKSLVKWRAHAVHNTRNFFKHRKK